MKRQMAPIFLALTLIFSTSCGKLVETTEVITELLPQRDAEEEIKAEQEVVPYDPVQELLDGLTTEEKVGQLFFVRCPEENSVEDVENFHLGGYIFFGRDTKDKTASELISTIDRYQTAAQQDTGIPLLIGVDEEGGTVVRVSSNAHLRSEKFDSPRNAYAKGGMTEVLSQTHQRDLLLLGLGFNVNLAPVADVSNDADDFIYARSFGDNPSQTADYVADVVAQMGADGIGSVLKHFPGYGNNVDTHTGIAVDSRSMETFRSEDFLPFQAGFTSTTAVLVSHNIVECMDAELPASLSPAVHEILRGELGFDGVAMTDDLAMDAVSAYAEDGAVAVMALQAGNDLVITTDYRTQIPKVLSAVESGALEMEIIDAACYRVLTWKMELGLLGA